jgi:hypothetical protein
LCYDIINCRVTKEEGCFGKIIGRNRESIAKPNTKTRVGTSKAYGREGIGVHNS